MEDNWILDKCNAETESRPEEEDDSTSDSEEDSDIEPELKRKKMTKNGLLSDDIHSGSPIKRMKTENTWKSSRFLNVYESIHCIQAVILLWHENDHGAYSKDQTLVQKC